MAFLYILSVLFEQNVKEKPTCFVAYFSCLSLDQDFWLAGQSTDIEEVLPLDHNLMRLNDFLGSVKDLQIQHFPKKQTFL